MKSSIFQNKLGGIVIVTCMLLCALSSSTALAESCTPDFVGHDNITKKPVQRWIQVLSSTGLLSEALMGNSLAIYARIHRDGDKNFIVIIIEKKDENLTRVAFESRYHASKGDQIILGFKNGDPLTFVATSVSNKAEKSGFLTSMLQMSAVWAAEVSDASMAAARDTLTKKQVDAIRISPANGDNFELAVSDETGKALMDKFGCFYEAVDKLGIDLSAAVTRVPPAAASAPSKPAKSATPLTIDQIIQMVSAKLADDIIITTIQNSSSKFDLTPEALIKLKGAGVSDAVIRAMTR